MSNAEDIAAIYRAGNNVVTDAYNHGVKVGRAEGNDEEARKNHEWLLNADERTAKAAREARRFALLDAAEAWENAERDEMKDLALSHYKPGGPSLPSIWLKLRAEFEVAS